MPLTTLLKFVYLIKDHFLKIIFSNYIKKKDIMINYAVISQSPRYILELIAFIGMMLIFGFKFYSENNIEDVISTMTLFLVSSLRLMPSINKLIVNNQNLKYFSKSVESINDFFKKDSSSNLNKKSLNFKDEISFEKRVIQL